VGQDSAATEPSGHAAFKRRFYNLRVLRNHYIENKDQPLFLHTITQMLETENLGREHFSRKQHSEMVGCARICLERREKAQHKNH
jgi:hypothetical protein